MKYITLSLVCGFVFVFTLLVIVKMDGKPAADYSYTGIWISKNEETGEEFEVSLSDSHLTVDGNLMEYDLIQNEDWLLFVTEDSYGQVPPNKITLLFEIQGKNKLELLSVGTKPVNGILNRK